MRSFLAPILLAVLLATGNGCSSTVLVSVPPRVDLKGYGTLGVVDFTSNSGGAGGARATQQLQEQIQAAQPGTRFIELGSREAVLAAVGRNQLDADAAKRIGKRYGVDAVFLGEIAYSDAKTDIRVNDLTKLDAGLRSEVLGDISARLVETASGASVWSNSGWVRRQVGRVNVSEQGISASMTKSDPREEMVPALVYQITHDFRPTTERRPAK
ncbi:MAG TPA: hypothetical protein VNH16_13075 [Burkholderiales bacterium]|jgi:hypothetical protein|nr:hypothetical protein [Burkholderiales bacterium]